MSIEFTTAFFPPSKRHAHLCPLCQYVGSLKATDDNESILPEGVEYADCYVCLADEKPALTLRYLCHDVDESAYDHEELYKVAQRAADNTFKFPDFLVMALANFGDEIQVIHDRFTTVGDEAGATEHDHIH